MTGNNRKNSTVSSAKPIESTFWTCGKTTLHTFGILAMNTNRSFTSFFASWSTVIVMPHTSYKIHIHHHQLTKPISNPNPGTNEAAENLKAHAKAKQV